MSGDQATWFGNKPLVQVVLMAKYAEPRKPSIEDCEDQARGQSTGHCWMMTNGPPLAVVMTSVPIGGVTNPSLKVRLIEKEPKFCAC